MDGAPDRALPDASPSSLAMFTSATSEVLLASSLLETLGST
jgi:hypothetical protein